MNHSILIHTNSPKSSFLIAITLIKVKFYKYVFMLLIDF